MLQFLGENAGTIGLSVLLILAVSAVIAHLVRRKKRGESSCGCGCGCCGAAETCHPKT